jgi:uncharacterized protein YbjQ (UPF0145 family)
MKAKKVGRGASVMRTSRTRCRLSRIATAYCSREPSAPCAELYERARQEAFDLMREHAAVVGANAVISMRSRRTRPAAIAGS